MAILDIRKAGDPVLRQKAKPVDRITRQLAKTLKDMEETMYAADGVGLAAPQVGLSLRMFVVDVGDGPIHIVNPVLEQAEGSHVDREGCLSIPGVWGYVERAARVVVTGLDSKGKPVRVEGEGLLARALLHEMDHLDGILFTDKALSISTVRDDDEEDNDDGRTGDEPGSVSQTLEGETPR